MSTELKRRLKTQVFGFKKQPTDGRDNLPTDESALTDASHGTLRLAGTLLSSFWFRFSLALNPVTAKLLPEPLTRR